MLRSFKPALRNPLLLGTAILILFLIFSYGLRQRDFETAAGAQGLEATYHTLLTVTALKESPAENHWYLPTVSLGRALDKYIPWGATVPTRTGDYIYTSFTPLGFLVPYLWFNTFDLEASVIDLARFNFALGSISAIILFFLLAGLLKFNGNGPWTSVGGALIGSSIGIFSREALLSHGVVYWSHSLYQPILGLSLFLIFRYLTATDKESCLLYSRAIFAVTFVGPLIEWTAYIFNAGLIIIFWLISRKLSSSKVLAVQIFAATAVACTITTLHFSIAIGFGPTIGSLLGRFLARNTSVGSALGLIQGYSLSYGLFALKVFPIFALANFSNRHQAIGNREKTAFIIFTAACIPLLENIMFLQHATQFSFDRLKFVFPASLMLAFSFAWFKITGRAALLALILLSSIHGYKSYQEDMSSYSSWGAIDAENKQLASKISAKVDVECSVFSSNSRVRGYANLLFHHGIYEGKSVQDARDLLANRNACASVYLEGALVLPDLPKYSMATITHNDGSTTVITSKTMR